MEPQYEDYFASAFDGASLEAEWHEYPPGELEFELRRMIEDADRRLRADGRPGLRADAKLFLLLNFRDMIVRPLDARGPEDVRADMRDYLLGDLMTLVGEASSEAVEEEVSAHQVVNALTRIWDRVSTLQLGVWDRHR